VLNLLLVNSHRFNVWNKEKKR